MSEINIQPKKRGRPRKTEAKTNSEINSSVKKKRGRPSKSSAGGKTSSNSSTKSTAKRKQAQKDIVFALDIGTRTIIGILGRRIDDLFEVMDIEVCEHKKRAMIDGQIEDIHQVGEIVEQVKQILEKRNNISLERVSVAAAGRALKTVQVKMDFDVSDREFISSDFIKSMEIEAVQKAQKQINSTKNEKNLEFYCVGHTVIRYLLDDYKMLTIEGHKGKTASVEVIAAFLPDLVLESLYTVMDNNSLSIESLTLEPIAAMNVVIPPEIRLINIALVDIGAGTSDIAISRDGSIIAYGMAVVAGDEITEEIIRTYLVDFPEAEQMKKNSVNDSFSYKDIFGVTHEINTEDFLNGIDNASLMLAKTISEEILKANTISPQAVFLVGGGSRLKGLSSKIAHYLDIDENRVAVGSEELIRNVAASKSFELGPEYVTPIGIGMTQGINQGYDFSTIILNDEKVRIFNKKEISVLELLTIAGIKSTQIMGRSGKNLIFTLNGERKVVKGKLQVPSRVSVNGVSGNLNSTVRQGDNVKFVSAVKGEDGKAFVRDFLNGEKGSIKFCSQLYTVGCYAVVNGKEAEADYEISDGDIVQIYEIYTLKDLIKRLGIEMEGIKYSKDSMVLPLDYKLNFGDVIDIDNNAFDFVQQEKQENKTLAEIMSNEDVFLEQKEISVRLNGKKINLPPKSDGSPYIFIDMYNLLDFNVADRGANLLMILNGIDANFTDVLKDGDDIIIR